MRRLEFENHLIQELMERGATPAEAQRLAALAQAMSRTKVHIDPRFADGVEALLLRDRPGEALAKIISITRTLDSEVHREQLTPRLHAVPETEFRRGRARLAVRASVAAAVVLFAAAAVILFAVVSVAQSVKSAPPKTQAEGPGITVPVPGDQNLNALKPMRTSQRASINSVIRDRPVVQPKPPTAIGDPSTPPPTTPRCTVAGQASPKAGASPVSISCSSAKSTATAPLS